ncbi:uncharacterized protein LOC143575772 [Bidens hawaiensis]|uniref:uncharacterized protein LOC143575772 n=1 Tax=Bidens hawaiensis TaxID=980011 RepID=UPI00404974BC
MDSGNSCSIQSFSSGDGGGHGGGVSLSPCFNPIPIHQPPSNFFNPSSFSSQPPNPNPNPNSVHNFPNFSNSNPVYDLDSYDSYLNPNPDSGPEKLTAKNPKKRTRASRRAPTTVLTTDTTNFRRMVQEFTGIPAAPFATSLSSSVFSRRSDFGMSPVQPFRPSAQKIHLQQQPPSYLNFPMTEFTKQPLNLSSLTNQTFPFQSISQVNNNNNLPPSEYVESSMKRWRGQDENLVNFQGVNGNSQNGVVPSSDGDQLPGNEDSWTF